ncbi:MAG: helix-turn-helix transcriptional regulator [Burkholderiaceae bacterium]|nr:helix-turn-helix transcriptional regulator [Burkholderiaceae bacterium]
MNIEDTPNHRTRVAARRRASTRARLLESALLVFARKGAHAAIDDVIVQAGMARGTFYNYFGTNDELLGELASEINNELLRAIDPVVQCSGDPAERIASGARLLLHTVMRFPLLGAFMARLPFPTANSSLLGLRFMARDVALGIAAKRFHDINQRVAADLVIGVVLSAAYAVAREPLDAGYPDASVRALLRALGLARREAARLVALPLPAFELPLDSILRRTQVFPGRGGVDLL